MTFPPPSPDPNRPGNGGGFGPPPQEPAQPSQPSQPQGTFGPPVDPGQLVPSPRPGPPVLPGGFGPPPPPPPPGGRPPGTGRSRTAAIVTGVAVGLAVVAGVAVFGARDDDGGDRAADAPAASNRPLSSPSGAASAPAGSEDPGQGAPLGGGDDRSAPSPDASETGNSRMPYAVLGPGTCFDHPAMDSSVTKIEKRSCKSPHDAEVISNKKLNGDFSSERAIQRKALSLCETDAEKRLESVPNDGREYYYYALYPALGTYTEHGKDRVSCALTVSTGKDGAKLKEPIPE
ncbi:hypothetical protein ACH4TX_23130 [Streptomyces sp. NPDC021098]|uniref:hypothetical protein n=1 Tax=unclassified Streptomyces TaxID=2593676 RepID=UPI00378A5F19